MIPMSLRPEMKRRLHAAHMGYDSMMARARETIFWPRMSSEVKQVADCCEVCQQMKPKQRNEPLMCHKDGDGPWRKIGVDLFDLNGTNYLLTIDYFSDLNGSGQVIIHDIVPSYRQAERAFRTVWNSVTARERQCSTVFVKRIQTICTTLEV